jgi:hypothetical protein
MPWLRTRGALALGAGILMTGCLSDPTLKTGLRPEGPPEVLAVLAVEPNVTNHEGPAFCKYVGAELDDKGPGFVQGATICPRLASDFEAEGLVPLGWDIRIVFDELLNGDAVEELDCDRNDDGEEDDPLICEGHIANTQPVTLTCGGAVIGYDGYYYPNGNKESFPVGPSLYVTPDPVVLGFPTGTDCNITINAVVVDKSGVGVAPGTDSSTFALRLQDLAVFQTDPVDADDLADREVIAPDRPVAFGFNANLDDASVTVADVALLDGAGAPIGTVDVFVDSFNGASDGVFIGSTVDLAPGNYTARLVSGATFTEMNGGSVTLTENIDVRFVVE